MANYFRTYTMRSTTPSKNYAFSPIQAGNFSSFHIFAIIWLIRLLSILFKNDPDWWFPLLFFCVSEDSSQRYCSVRSLNQLTRSPKMAFHRKDNSQRILFPSHGQRRNKQMSVNHFNLSKSEPMFQKFAAGLLSANMIFFHQMLFAQIMNYNHESYSAGSFQRNQSVLTTIYDTIVGPLDAIKIVDLAQVEQQTSFALAFYIKLKHVKPLDSHASTHLEGAILKVAKVKCLHQLWKSKST